MFSALQQNRGNIWSQYFPHCLPSPCSPSLLICFTLTQSLVSLFPLALPHFLLDVSKEKNDFLFIQKTARKESENSALFTNNIRHPSHHAICGVSCMCSFFRAATSGATVLKVGVRWSPAIAVYENRVRVFTILIPGLCEPLAHHSCCGS